VRGEEEALRAVAGGGVGNDEQKALIAAFGHAASDHLIRLLPKPAFFPFATMNTTLAAQERITRPPA